MKVHCTLSELEGNYSRNMMFFFFPLRVERLSHLQLVMCLSSNGYTPFFVLIMIPWSVFFYNQRQFVWVHNYFQDLKHTESINSFKTIFILFYYRYLY